jgi:hypothetical protein
VGLVVKVLEYTLMVEHNGIGYYISVISEYSLSSKITCCLLQIKIDYLDRCNCNL